MPGGVPGGWKDTPHAILFYCIVEKTESINPRGVGGGGGGPCNLGHSRPKTAELGELETCIQ